jgi:hypothetical protein
MLPESRKALEYLHGLKKAPTVDTFKKEFEPNGEFILNSILESHVDVVKGKVVLNENGVRFATGVN